MVPREEQSQAASLELPTNRGEMLQESECVAVSIPMARGVRCGAWGTRDSHPSVVASHGGPKETWDEASLDFRTGKGFEPGKPKLRAKKPR